MTVYGLHAPHEQIHPGHCWMRWSWPSGPAGAALQATWVALGTGEASNEPTSFHSMDRKPRDPERRSAPPGYASAST